jgi:putative transposase
VSNTFGISSEDILAKCKGNIYRILALYIIKNYTSLSLKEIGKIFFMDYTAVSQATRRFEEKISKDKRISDKVDRITERLKIAMSNVKT